MSSKPIYYYVYRITNISENKHYYGCRKSEIPPHKDLGVKYFSSSYDKDFIEEQKKNPNKFKYKVVKIFSNYLKCIEFESKLHRKFNVASNENFYNMQCQTCSKFTTKGMVTVKWSDNRNDERFLVSVDDPRYKSGEVVHFLKGKKLSDKTIQKIKESKKNKKRVYTEEEREAVSRRFKNKKLSKERRIQISECTKGIKKSREHKEKLAESAKGFKHSNESKMKMKKSSKHLIPCKWKDGRSNEIIAVEKTDPRYKSGELVHMAKNVEPKNKGMVRATDIKTGKRKFIRKDDERLTKENVYRLGW